MPKLERAVEVLDSLVYILNDQYFWPTLNFIAMPNLITQPYIQCLIRSKIKYCRNFVGIFFSFCWSLSYGFSLDSGIFLLASGEKVWVFGGIS